MNNNQLITVQPLKGHSTSRKSHHNLETMQLWQKAVIIIIYHQSTSLTDFIIGNILTYYTTTGMETFCKHTTSVRRDVLNIVYQYTHHH